MPPKQIFHRVTGGIFASKKTNTGRKDADGRTIWATKGGGEFVMRDGSKAAPREHASRSSESCKRAQKSLAAQKALVTRMRTSPTSTWYTSYAISNVLNLPEPFVQLQQFLRLSQANQQRKRDDMLREQDKAYANLVSDVRRTCGPTLTNLPYHLIASHIAPHLTPRDMPKIGVSPENVHRIVKSRIHESRAHVSKAIAMMAARIVTIVHAMEAKSEAIGGVAAAPGHEILEHGIKFKFGGVTVSISETRFGEEDVNPHEGDHHGHNGFDVLDPDYRNFRGDVRTTAVRGFHLYFAHKDKKKAVDVDLMKYKTTKTGSSWHYQLGFMLRKFSRPADTDRDRHFVQFTYAVSREILRQWSHKPLKIFDTRKVSERDETEQKKIFLTGDTTRAVLYIYDTDFSP